DGDGSVNAENGLTVPCTDESPASLMDIPNTDITNWEWDFGDGSPVSHAQNPSHTYAQGGTYEIRLTITRANGMTSSIRKSVTVSSLCLGVTDIPYQECLALEAAYSKMDGINWSD